MKRLTCEMCGGTDLIKQDGVFVCQSCGCKYSLEEARKMMIEGTVEITGTVKVDNSAAIENYLKMARNALEASNNEEAENYANKIIELDPQNSSAWEIKGEAAGWQSKSNNNRIGEAVTAWLNAIQYSSANELDELRERIANNYTGLLLAMIKLQIGYFGRIQDKDNLNNTLKDLKNGIDMMNMLMTKGGISFNRGPIYTQIAKMLNEGACAGYKDAKSNFGPEHHNMSKWQWERFTKACDNCLTMLEKAAEYSRDNSLGRQICDNLVTIAETARDSNSWKFDVDSFTADHYVKEFSFTDKAKEIRSDKIKEYKDKKEYFIKDHIWFIINMIQGTRDKEDAERAKTAYWNEHTEEKAQLEKERGDLTQHIAEQRSLLDRLPASIGVEETSKKIGDLTRTKLSLGMFKGKEKKNLQDQIDKLEEIKKQQLGQVEAEKKPIQDAIINSEKRIKDINAEFVKDRGRLSLKSEDNWISDAISNGKFNISVQQFADHLSTVLPSTFTLDGIKESNSTFKDFGHQYQINFVLAGVDKKDSNTGIMLYCTADDINAPIQNIIMEGFSGIAEGESGKVNWAIFGSYILMSIFGEITQSDAEKEVLNLRYANDRTLWIREGLRCELATNSINLLGMVTLNKDALIIRPLLDK